MADLIPADEFLRVPKSTFDPEGDGYDYTTAAAAGLKPGADGHWPSRDPRTGQLLKGKKHKTWDLLEQGEARMGMEISRGKDGRYYSQPKKLLSLDEFLGPSKFTDEANLDPRDLRARGMTAQQPEPPRGFMANIRAQKWNPVELWSQESLPANIYHAYKRGVFNKPISELIAAGKLKADEFDLGKVADAIMKDPGGAGAQMLHALWTDPWLAAVPIGLGGAVARPLSRVASVGPKTAGVVGAVGRTGEAAAVGAAANVAIEGGKQFKERGEVLTEDMAAAGKLGAALGAAFGAVFSGARGYREGSRGARMREARAAEERLAKEREQAELFEILAPTKQNYARPGRGETVEGEVIPDTSRLPAPPRQLAAPRGQEGAIGPEIKNFTDDDLRALGMNREQLGQVLDEEGGITTRVKNPRELSQTQRIAMMASLGVGSATGLFLANAWSEADQKGVPLWEVIKDRLNRRPTTAPRDLEQEPKETPEGTMFGMENLLPLALAGAVKGKGGMWHPEAPKRLADSINVRLINEAPLREAGEIGSPAYERRLAEMHAGAWGTKAVRNYLNKYAGTKEDPLSGYVTVQELQGDIKDATRLLAEVKQLKPPVREAKLNDTPEKTQRRYEQRLVRFAERQEEAKEVAVRLQQLQDLVKGRAVTALVKDPLREVEIPFGEGTKKWEEVTDAIFKSEPAKYYFENKRIADPAHAEVRQSFLPALEQGKFEALDEPVWRVRDLDHGMAGPWEGGQAFKNYLSHVADYLRQNVVPRVGAFSWYTDIASRKFKDAHPLPAVLAGLTRNDYAAALTDAQAAAYSKWIREVGDSAEYKAYKVEDPLRNYDFVRAVRETAANDARVAKEMEKAQAASTKDLPVYKEYPNGFKWVELKLPEKLTEEQRRQVREIKPGEELWKQLSRETDMAGEGDLVAGRDKVWIALDAQGKPLTNSFTGERAAGPSPEEAFLAGQLAQEGNSMGHCVGGYCQGVASGEQRIFSLRDPKGKSHVTVETALPDVRRPANSPAVFLQTLSKDHPLRTEWQRTLGDIISEISIIQSPEFRRWISQKPQDILQIKGKQNRAPVAEYLPYVQDFVRSGKWGEVEDLVNTGLADTEAKLALSWPQGTTKAQADEVIARLGGTSDAVVKAAREASGGQRFITEKEFTDFLDSQIKRGRTGQEGFADPRLLRKLAVMGIGGVIGANYFEDSLSGAALGAILAGLGVPAAAGLGKTVEQLGGALSTSLRNIHPSLQKLGRDYEQGVLKQSYDWLVAGDPFLVRLNKLPGDLQKEFKIALLNGDEAAVKKVLKELDDPKAFEEFQRIRDTLDSVGSKLRSAGRFKEMVKDYFPRLVKDPKGLLEAIGSASRTVLERRLAEAEKSAMSTRGVGLSDLERSAIINKHLAQTHRQHAGQPGWAKMRRIGEVTDELEPFYASPTEAYHAYIRSAAKDIERAKFFGRDLALVEKNGQRHINVPGSIGNMVERLVREKKIGPEQVEELTKLLENRFGAAELGVGGKVQDFRNYTNAALLGNPISASVQLGDIATAVFMHGLKPTLSAVVRTVTGKPKVRMQDFGLVDHISEEFISTRSSAKFLNSMLKYSGFSLIDSFGKNVNLNAALAKYQRWSQTAAGVEKIARKYGEAYGDAFPELVSDLRKGEMTPHVRSLLFQELSDAQPISPLEMPFGYHESKKLQSWGGAPILAYQLKSFVLKQIDLVRKEAIQEILKGNSVRGTYNLARYALLLGAAGASTDMLKDWLLGRPFDARWSDIPMNVLKTFGLSEYVLDKAVGADGKRPEPVKAAVGVITPPYKIMDDLVAKDSRAVKYIPLVGRLYYEHSMGGAEKAAEAKERRERRKERESQ